MEYERKALPTPSRRLKRRLSTKRKQHCGSRKGPRDIWAEGKTKVLGATRLHWANLRVSVAVPDSLSDARMAGIGASRPLRRIPGIVSFLNPQPAFSLVGGNRSLCPRACENVLT